MELKEFSGTLHRLRSLERKLVREFEVNAGFSLTRYEILTYLSQKGDSLQADIANYIGLDPAAITRQLKILEKENYVKRKRNEENAREIIVSLTDFAKEELKHCDKKNKNSVCDVRVSVQKEDLEKLVEVLDSINDKINEGE